MEPPGGNPRPILVFGTPSPVRKRPLQYWCPTVLVLRRPLGVPRIRANLRAFVSGTVRSCSSGNPLGGGFTSGAAWVDAGTPRPRHPSPGADPYMTAPWQSVQSNQGPSREDSHLANSSASPSGAAFLSHRPHQRQTADGVCGGALRTNLLGGTHSPPVRV